MMLSRSASGWTSVCLSAKHGREGPLAPIRAFVVDFRAGLRLSPCCLCRLVAHFEVRVSMQQCQMRPDEDKVRIRLHRAALTLLLLVCSLESAQFQPVWTILPTVYGTIFSPSTINYY